MGHDDLLGWIDRYEHAWRTPGTDALGGLFTADASYLTTPYAEPLVGLSAIAGFWEAEREGPDEVFSLEREAVAVEAGAGVAQVRVRYGSPVRQEYLDLWIVRLDADGRASWFEEWPFWPGKGRGPGDTD